MYVYQKEFEIEEGLSLGGLFRLFQDVSTIHCDALGLGMEVIGPRGLIWVVARQLLQVERWPAAGERISIKTWPGPTRHMMFPRFYTVLDAGGEKIMEGSAIWTMVDMESRKMVSPGSYGFELEGCVTGEEGPTPKAPKRLETGGSGSFTVPESYIDGNKHMNNTRYYDIACSSLAGETGGLRLKRAVTEFAAEARLGDDIALSWGREEKRFYIEGRGSALIFRMSLEYE